MRRALLGVLAFVLGGVGLFWVLTIPDGWHPTGSAALPAPTPRAARASSGPAAAPRATPRRGRRAMTGNDGNADPNVTPRTRVPPADHTDPDGDGIVNGIDELPDDANPGQADLDGDRLGDALISPMTTSVFTSLTPARSPMHATRRRSTISTPTRDAA